MVPTAFDIFKTENNEVLWIESVPDLVTAEQRVRAIGELSPGTYLVLDEATGNKISIDVDAHGNNFVRPFAPVPPA